MRHCARAFAACGARLPPNSFLTTSATPLAAGMTEGSFRKASLGSLAALETIPSDVWVYAVMPSLTAAEILPLRAVSTQWRGFVMTDDVWLDKLTTLSLQYPSLLCTLSRRLTSRCSPGFGAACAPSVMASISLGDMRVASTHTCSSTARLTTQCLHRML